MNQTGQQRCWPAFFFLENVMMGKKMGDMMSKTIKKEMKAGKPQKQAVAMAYSMNKPAKKAAKKK
jgi:hypothetical protein